MIRRVGECGALERRSERKARLVIILFLQLPGQRNMSSFGARLVLESTVVGESSVKKIAAIGRTQGPEERVTPGWDSCPRAPGALVRFISVR